MPYLYTIQEMFVKQVVHNLLTKDHSFESFYDINPRDFNRLLTKNPEGKVTPVYVK